ncbi:Transposon TX1 uncharacterized 82 kDa protein ORF 1 [Takifugu flavidus]|uniref:Transposon TX1 uncharacterized 82 kDa protein ORF 1 n=1 Tax=Takifugu flavidus TaxID=433684 RepID=A0A5C6PTH6_9TELE|nr:Transposon TX1 uncharacterized 82 kDa protein ORF 1 [Takifugu flavidus]
MAAAPGAFAFDKLTRRHGVKLSPPTGVSVEECALAVGDIVGHGSVKSASRMSKMVVVFVDNTDKADQLVTTGVVINGELTPVLPLSNPVKKVVVSNVPPFFKNDMLLRELSRHGRIVSPMRLIPLGTKSPLLRHVVSFRRQVSMVLNNNVEELRLSLRFRVDDYDYTVFVTTDSQKCLCCGEEGHLIRSCPKGAEARQPADPPVSAAPHRMTGTASPRRVIQGTMAGTTVEAEEPAGLQGDHLELGSERTTRELVEQTAIRVAETVLEMVDAVVEENGLNVSIKRKNTDTKAKNDKIKRLSTEEQVSPAFGPAVDAPGLQDGQVMIRSFLKNTKGMRSVQAGDYFPDLQLFQESVRHLMRAGSLGEPSFTDQEIYRLKKLLQKPGLSGWLASDAMVFGGGSGDLSRLTRRHGVKVGTGSLYTVEEVEQANRLVETGISVGGRFEAVLPLTQPSTRITLSNVPPFISDEFLARELARFGKIVSPIKKETSLYDIK